MCIILEYNHVVLCYKMSLHEAFILTFHRFIVFHILSMWLILCAHEERRPWQDVPYLIGRVIKHYTGTLECGVG